MSEDTLSMVDAKYNKSYACFNITANILHTNHKISSSRQTTHSLCLINFS